VLVLVLVALDFVAVLPVTEPPLPPAPVVSRGASPEQAINPSAAAASANPKQSVFIVATSSSQPL
jgi:hypothetical protein